VRILILGSSYQDLVNAGNKFPFRPGMTASVDIMTTTKQNAFQSAASVTTRNPDDQQEGKNQRSESPDRNAGKRRRRLKRSRQNGDLCNEKEGENGGVKTGISDYDNIEILEGISDSTGSVIGPFLAVSKRLKDGEKISRWKEERA